jgi:hypothetical protein
MAAPGADTCPTAQARVIANIRAPNFNTQNGDYTFALADAGGVVYHSSASAHAYTLPPAGDVAFAIGAVIDIVNIGAGAVTLTRGSGVSLYWANGSAPSSANRTIGQGCMARVRKISASEWVVAAPAGLT